MRLRWILAGAGVLLVACALVLYLTQMPAKVANDYESRAEPQHGRVGKAIQPVIDTFDYETFAVVEVDEDLAPRKYLRALRRATSRDLRELEKARRAVRKAKRTLARVDEEELTHVSDWPLLGGTGDVEEASKVADQAGAYLRKARAYVRDYQELVEYSVDLVRFGDREVAAQVRAELAFPARPTSPAQIARPLERAHEILIVELARFKRHRPPEEQFSQYHRIIRETEAQLRLETKYIAAVKRNDFSRSERLRKKLNRDVDRSSRRSRRDLARLMERSRFKKRVDDLQRRESRIADAFDDL